VERFGGQLQVTESDKKKMRVERFGDVSGGLDKKSKKGPNLKPNTAAARLGLPVKTAAESTQLTEDKLAARRAKFGVVTADGSTTSTPSLASTKPALTKPAGPGKAKLGLSQEDLEKLQKRKERFATPATTTSA